MNPARTLLIASAILTSCLPTTFAQEIEFLDQPIHNEPASPWKGSFAAGLNGKTGNSVNTDINMTLKLDREDQYGSLALLASYFYASNDIATTTDRFFGQARHEIKLPSPKWSWFNQIQVESDRFKDFDYRIALHTGLGYEVYKTDQGFLKLRMGAGKLSLNLKRT